MKLRTKIILSLSALLVFGGAVWVVQAPSLSDKIISNKVENLGAGKTRFDWQNSPNENKSARTSYTKNFLHPTDPTKRVLIQSSNVLHALTNTGFEELGKEIPAYDFPEGKKFNSISSSYYIMDLPRWASFEFNEDKSKVLMVDKAGEVIKEYRDLLAKSSSSSITAIGTFEVVDSKLFAKFPILTVPFWAYDLAESSSVNNGFDKVTSDSPTTRDNTSAQVEIGWYSPASQKIRHFEKFTLSAVPGGGPWQIDAMTINIVNTSTAGTGMSVEVHKSDQAFVTTEATWNVWSTGNNWVTGGGDYGATLDTVVSDTASFKTWNILGAGYTWGDAAYLIFLDTTESGASHYWTIQTSAITPAANRPYIEITYSASAVAATVFNQLLFTE